jgi:hypothetical protein
MPPSGCGSSGYLRCFSLSTWLLPVDVARRLHVELGDKLTTNREGKE